MGYRAFRVKMLKVSPKMSARWPQDGPTMAQDGPKMAPGRPQDGLKMASCWPRWRHDGEDGTKMDQEAFMKQICSNIIGQP